MSISDPLDYSLSGTKRSIVDPLKYLSSGLTVDSISHPLLKCSLAGHNGRFQTRWSARCPTRNTDFGPVECSLSGLQNVDFGPGIFYVLFILFFGCMYGDSYRSSGVRQFWSSIVYDLVQP